MKKEIKTAVKKIVAISQQIKALNEDINELDYQRSLLERENAVLLEYIQDLA